MLSNISFELEFDLPYSYVKEFLYFHRKGIIEPLMNGKDLAIQEEFFHHYDIWFFNLIKKLLIDSYSHPYCLYFPAPVIAAACVLFGARTYNMNTH